MLLGVRVCVVYDCLFPYTVGGAERWYRNLAQRLAADGHEVTYLTLRQWDRDAVAGAGGGRERRRGRAATGALHRKTGAAGSCRRSRSAWASFGTCCAADAAMTSCTALRSPTSRCSRPASRARSAATAWSSTGTRCGATSTGASTWGRLGGRDRRAGTAPVRARAPARILLLAAARRAPARGGPARRADGAGGRVRRLHAASRGASRSTRWSCSPAA